MKPKVYIDGKEGTTGLQIYDRLASRDDIELLLIDETKRKDPDERKKLINAADITFLPAGCGGEGGGEFCGEGFREDHRCLHGAPYSTRLGIRDSGAFRYA